MSVQQKSSAILALERERELLRSQNKLVEGDKVDLAIDAEIEAIETKERQEWFKLAAGPGMDPVSLSGLGNTGIGYAPQRDITKTFPTSLSEREEEERLALRAPGLATFGQPYSWT